MSTRELELAHRTRVVLGAGVWVRALSEVRELGTRILLVTGASSLGRLDLESALSDEARRLGLHFARFCVPREPDIELADQAATLARTEAAEAVLAIGGGSALDVAKAAAALATNPGSARDYLEGLPNSPKVITRPPLPIVCVPTTAGTGSEVTKNSVLQVPDLQVKRSMRSELLFPRAAFIDPTLSCRAPHAVRGGTGFDALTHLAEAFCSRNASAVTDALARDGIPRAANALRKLASGKAGEVEAWDLALASTLGGICLANAGLGAAHGLIAPLGGLYPSIPHGAGLACLLPATLTVNEEAARQDSSASARLAELAQLLGGPAATIGSAAAELSQLRRTLTLPSLASYASIDVSRVIASPSVRSANASCARFWNARSTTKRDNAMLEAQMSLRSALCLIGVAATSSAACHRTPEPPAPEKSAAVPPAASAEAPKPAEPSVPVPAPSADPAPVSAPSVATTHSKIKHVIVIAMENHDAEEIYGDTDNAPYIHSLLEKYAHSDDFEDELPLEIPSEPHYVWMEAGTNQFSDVTFTDDNPPSASLSTGSDKHLVTQIKNAKNGVSWLTYQEGMDEHTGACPIAYFGFYAPKHNPFIFFRDVSGDPPSKDAAYCAAHHKPYSALERDLARELPSYVFITPNECHDMHGQRGCPEENPIRTGDSWLKAELPRLIAYADKHDTVIFIAFDEGGSTLKLPFIAVGPMVKPHYTGKQRYTHSSLLKSVELVLGLPPLPTVASSVDLSDLFKAGSFP